MSLSLGHEDGHIRKRRRLDDIQDEESLQDEGQTTAESIRLSRNDYKVGWICALPLELAAAKAMLDSEHYSLPNPANDNNNYHFGSICGHNVVITCLPSGIYGTNAAAVVATRMMSTFESITMPLMVGIGGGVPKPFHDIRLGDVVVSNPSPEYPAVVQYDFGKTGVRGTSEPKGVLNKPKTSLLRAVANLRAEYGFGSSKVSFNMQKAIEKLSLAEHGYIYPGCEADVLFDYECEHEQEDSCDSTCAQPKPIQRVPRSTTNPVIHYGTIGSGNQVIKHGRTRDRLAEKYNILCFEMEAAGLMDEHQCLVIRGICDYCDIHKNKSFQGHAALAAAAVAKELLSTITPKEPPSYFDISRQGVSRSEHRQSIMQALYFEESDNRRAAVRTAHVQTCRWLLSKPEYIDWLDPDRFGEHHGLLWIKGKAGSGKSTLIKFVLERTEKENNPNLVKISFFFNARGHDLEKSTIGMYRSLLYQLFKQIPELQALLDKVSPKLVSSCFKPELLEDILKHAVMRLGSKTLICFVDALDECPEEQIRRMVQLFQDIGDTAFSKKIRLHVLFSSRHYPNISIDVGNLLTLEEQDGHSEDLVKYIHTELKIGKNKSVDRIKEEIMRKSAGIFLWVVLVIRILRKEYDKGRVHELENRLEDIPLELDDLFRDILTRDNERLPELLLCMQWVLYAKRPLHREEFYFALRAGINLDEDLPPCDPAVTTTAVMNNLILDASKGLVELTRSKNPSVSFIHESVREFLLKPGALAGLYDNFPGISKGQSHQKLRDCCERQLRSCTFDQLGMLDKLPDFRSKKAVEMKEKAQEIFPFLGYSVEYIYYHADCAQLSGISQAQYLKNFDEILWFGLHTIFQKHAGNRLHPTTLDDVRLVISQFLAKRNLGTIFAHYCHMFPGDSLSVDSLRRHSLPGPSLSSNLIVLIRQGNLDACKLFFKLNDGLSSSPQDPCPEHIDTLLTLASHVSALKRKGWNAAKPLHTIIKLLLLWPNVPQGYDLDELLNFAVKVRHEPSISLLCNKGADPDTRCVGISPLESLLGVSWEPKKITFSSGEMPKVLAETLSCTEVLLRHGASAESTGLLDSKPLLAAARWCDGPIITMLLAYGADVNADNDDQETALHTAVKASNLSAVEALLLHKLNPDSRDGYHRTPLQYIAKASSEAANETASKNRKIAKILLENGAEVNVRNDTGETPLHYASAKMAEILLANGADINARNAFGETALYHACAKKAKILLANGAEINTRSPSGRTPLHSWVCLKGYDKQDLIEILLDSEANSDARDDDGKTPLHLAVLQPNLDAVQALLTYGAQPNLRDNHGRTPLHILCSDANRSDRTRLVQKEIIALLLHSGTTVNLLDNKGRTPILRAILELRIDVAKLLYDHGGDLENLQITMESDQGRLRAQCILIKLQKSKRVTPCCSLYVELMTSESGPAERPANALERSQSLMLSSASMTSKAERRKPTVIDLERSPSIASCSGPTNSSTRSTQMPIIDLERSPSVLSCSVSSPKMEQDDWSTSNASPNAKASLVSKSLDSVHLNDSRRNQGHCSSSRNSILEWIKKV